VVQRWPSGSGRLLPTAPLPDPARARRRALPDPSASRPAAPRFPQPTAATARPRPRPKRACRPKRAHGPPLTAALMQTVPAPRRKILPDATRLHGRAPAPGPAGDLGRQPADRPALPLRGATRASSRGLRLLRAVSYALHGGDLLSTTLTRPPSKPGASAGRQLDQRSTQPVSRVSRCRNPPRHEHGRRPGRASARAGGRCSPRRRATSRATAGLTRRGLLAGWVHAPTRGSVHHRSCLGACAGLAPKCNRSLGACAEACAQVHRSLGACAEASPYRTPPNRSGTLPMNPRGGRECLAFRRMSTIVKQGFEAARSRRGPARP